MLSTASNHSYDFGENAVLTNIDYLDEQNMPQAGTGRNLAEARAPRYLETPKGRVALLSATTSGPAGGRAGEQRRDISGRPGANYIRHTTEYVVDRPTFDALKQVSEALGFEQQKRDKGGIFAAGGPVDTDTEFHLTGLFPSYDSISHVKFTLGESVERHSSPNWDDLEGTLQRVRDARRMAQWVVISVHSHESGATHDDPSEHLMTIARACIDAGADVFLGHGPHQDRAIEIYNGKPIFYALGDFFLQNDTVLLMPHDNLVRQGLGWEATPADFYDKRSANDTTGQTVQPIRWQTALARTTWRQGELAEIRLHPVDLGYGKARSERGRPVLAQDEVAQEVLERFQRLSAPFGTTVDLEDGVGVIRP
jgi:poly-gamma-glutamate synthesis protein (capsule biosynthesis protein)